MYTVCKFECDFVFDFTGNRSVGETNMNDRSSRSHTIFTLTIESRLRDEEGGDGTVRVASLVISLLIPNSTLQNVAPKYKHTLILYSPGNNFCGCISKLKNKN